MTSLLILSDELFAYFFNHELTSQQVISLKG